MTLPDFSSLVPGTLDLEPYEGWPPSVHDLSLKEVLAIKAAVAAGRPLLVRGEPGTGKTQLARAAAVGLQRHFVSKTLNAHTEARELFWTLDAVRRLSEAQLLAATYAQARATARPDQGGSEDDRAVLKRELAEIRFVDPGVLWWAFDWTAAAEQQQRCRGGSLRAPAPWVKREAGSPGTVVLLDEIDKADPVLPNALLEALGVGRFDGPTGCAPISTTAPAPLVIITTNEERALPHAFVRRCAVLNLSLPDDSSALQARLIQRGQQHGRLLEVRPGEEVLAECARLLADDRKAYSERGLPRPGQAEFLDLLRATCRLSTDEATRLKLLEQLKPFVLEKYERLATASA